MEWNEINCFLAAVEWNWVVWAAFTFFICWVMGRRPLCRLHISFRKRSLPSFQFSCPFISCCPSEECSLELSFFKDKWRELNVIEWDELTGVKSITAEGNPRNHWWNQWVKGQSTIHFIQLIQFQRNSIN